jgi:hypothetical protein
MAKYTLCSEFEECSQSPWSSNEYGKRVLVPDTRLHSQSPRTPLLYRTISVIEMGPVFAKSTRSFRKMVRLDRIVYAVCRGANQDRQREAVVYTICVRESKDGQNETR